MTIKHPIISIILPTHNGNPRWLSESIDSVLNQSYENFELIIIDDGSTNNIEETILTYAKKDKRIHYHKNTENLNLTKTLNIGIQFSQGEYIARIDDDDIWCDKDKLLKQMDRMQNNPSYGIIGTQAYVIDQNGHTIGEINHYCQNTSIKSSLLFTNQFVHSSVLIRKLVLEEIGLYDHKWNYIEDYELWLRIGTVYKLYNLQDQCVYYRVNTESVSHKNYYKQQKLNFLITFIFKNYYPGFWSALLKKFLFFMFPKKIILLLPKRIINMIRKYYF